MSLASAKSNLAFTSTKNGLITEIHSIPQLSGSISESGQAEVILDLTSVATGIDIRDERMRKLLFNTADFAEASFTASVGKILKAAEQSPVVTTLDGKLSLHGKVASVSFEVLVVKAGSSVVVSTLKPTAVNAADYGLAAGIDKLREIAGLTTIGQMVPVSFALTFE